MAPMEVEITPPLREIYKKVREEAVATTNGFHSRKGRMISGTSRWIVRMKKRSSTGRSSKAAEDSRTPGRWRVFKSATTSARFWSAAVLCRFLLGSL